MTSIVKAIIPIQQNTNIKKTFIKIVPTHCFACAAAILTVLCLYSALEKHKLI